ncbi:sensor histidine kinase [Methanosalsum natronophilum]|nr:ATP-binding protein [Methanosalsum natronophilum]MCS3923492.1 PAS domain S-box-containing protein [Methanosalsum natronophilum]
MSRFRKFPNEELTNIINSSPAIIFLWKPEDGWPVEFVSDNILQFGYDANEFLSGKLKYSDIIHPQDLDRVKEEFSKPKKSDSQGFTIDYRVLTKSNEIRWVHERTIVRRDADGNITNYEGVVFDITERKNAENEVKLNYDLLRSLLTLNDMTYSSLQEITNFAREEAVRLTNSNLGYLAFTNADETVLTMHSWSKAAMNECEIKEKRFVYPLKTTGLWGEPIRQRRTVITNNYSEPSSLKKGYPSGHVELRNHIGVPIFDGERIVGVVGVGNKDGGYNDYDGLKLTLLIKGMWKLIQKKHIEEALYKYSTDFSKSNSELKSLAKIRTDISEKQENDSQYISYSQRLQNEMMDSIEAEYNKILNKTLMKSEKLGRLIESLTFLSKEQAGKLHYCFQPVDVKEIINSSIMNLILIADENNISILDNIPENLPPIKADRDKFSNVMINLIENSIKHTNQNGAVKIVASSDNENVYIDIIDYGKGIPPTIIPHLFQSIYQVDDSLSRRYEGIESGLYICKKVIDSHNGTIWIESEVGKGTTAHISIPVFQEKDNIK